jgi:hypothetical protein
MVPGMIDDALAHLTDSLLCLIGCLFAISPAPSNPFTRAQVAFGLGERRFMKGSIPLSPVSTEWYQV